MTSARRRRREPWLTDPDVAPARRSMAVAGTAIVAVVLVVLTVGAVVGAVVSARHRTSLARHGAPATGTVGEVTPTGHGGGDLQIRFSTAAGVAVLAEVSVGHLLATGQAVTLRYDVTDPANAELTGASAAAADAFGPDPSTWVTVAIGCGVLTVADLALLVRLRRRAAAADRA